MNFRKSAASRRTFFLLAAMARKRNRQAIAWLKWTANAAGRRLQ